MRCNGKMSYKDYIFPVNPRSIRISNDRKIARESVPGGADAVSDFGSGARVISGEGEFYGSDAAESFDGLRSVMTSGGGGMLYIPSRKPIYAVAKKLVFDAADTEGLIRYSFVFIECFDNAKEDMPSEIYGDGHSTLWDISDRTGTDIDLLVSLNGHIRRPDIPISAGERVVLC